MSVRLCRCVCLIKRPPEDTRQEDKNALLMLLVLNGSCFAVVLALVTVLVLLCLDFAGVGVVHSLRGFDAGLE